MSILCLYINIKYIWNILFKINRVIGYNEYELIFNIFIIFYGAIFLIINIIYWSFSPICKQNDNNNNRNATINNVRNIYENQANYIHPIDQIDNNNNIISNEIINKRNINSNSDNKSSNLNKECIICVNNPIEIIFIPCKHRCLCKECYNECKKKNDVIIQNCPICRKQILSIKEGKTNKTFDVYFNE